MSRSKFWTIFLMSHIVLTTCHETEYNDKDIFLKLPSVILDNCTMTDLYTRNETLLDASLKCLQTLVYEFEKQFSDDKMTPDSTNSTRGSTTIIDSGIYVQKRSLGLPKVDNATAAKTDSLVDEGRGRKRKNMMMSLMMFGLVAVGMIMIPMGFQFLAVLGGKALLLSKMALLLTSIQGLKKIATSNVNYGLYSTIPQENWHYDRQWANPHEGYTPPNYDYHVPDQYTDLRYPIRRSIITSEEEDTK